LTLFNAHAHYLQIETWGFNMQEYIHRYLEGELAECLSQFPCTAIIGPRQCGKTSLAQAISVDRKTVYLDLERPADVRRLQEPEFFLDEHKSHLICLDEIQRVPELFPVLRGWIDRNRDARILILGSASRDLIRQSSESLAGRIAYIELTPFMGREVYSQGIAERTLWMRGGFPDSLLAQSDKASVRWRSSFVQSFLERDIPALGFNIPARTLGRVWSMCAHYHGQTLNSSALGQSLGVSHTSVRRYVELLSQTFMLRILPPFDVNLKKRLVKAPKIYLRDSGILHALLGIDDFSSLLGHPLYGASWEGFAMEQVLARFPDWKYGFYRTSDGTEMDLVLEKGGRRIGFEFKASAAPSVTAGFWNSFDVLGLDQAFVVAPVESGYPLKNNVRVIAVSELDDFVGCLPPYL
jgi:predicted AAA+ superfamily ATPase